MLQDLLVTILAVSEPGSGVLVTQGLDDVDEVLRVGDMRVLLLIWEDDLSPHGLLSDVLPQWAVERRETNDELIDHDSDAPPVDLLTVATVLPDLRGDVLRRAAESVGQILLVDLLGQTIVDDGYVAILVEKCVLQLDVAVRDSLLLVQVSDGEDDLNGPELDGTLANAAHALKHVVELGALEEWHDEVEA
jgi:hypothetical protein